MKKLREAHEQEHWLTVKEIADRLQVDEQTVRRWLREGRLKGINFGGKTGYRVREADLGEFFAADPKAGPVKPTHAVYSTWKTPGKLDFDNFVFSVHVRFGPHVAILPGNVGWYLIPVSDNTVVSVDLYDSEDNAERAAKMHVPVMRADMSSTFAELVDYRVVPVASISLHPYIPPNMLERR